MTGILKELIKIGSILCYSETLLPFEMWLSWSLYIQEIFGTLENY